MYSPVFSSCWPTPSWPCGRSIQGFEIASRPSKGKCGNIPIFSLATKMFDIQVDSRAPSRPDARFRSFPLSAVVERLAVSYDRRQPVSSARNERPPRLTDGKAALGKFPSSAPVELKADRLCWWNETRFLNNRRTFCGLARGQRPGAVKDLVSWSAPHRRFNGRQVDLLHRHHRLAGTLGHFAPGRHGFSQPSREIHKNKGARLFRSGERVSPAFHNDPAIKKGRQVILSALRFEQYPSQK